MQRSVEWGGDASDIRHGRFWADSIHSPASPASDPHIVPAGNGRGGQVAGGGGNGRDDLRGPNDDEVAPIVQKILETNPGPITLYAHKHDIDMDTYIHIPMVC